MILEIDSAGWVAIIGAIATASTVIAGAAVLVIVALGNLNRKVDSNASSTNQKLDTAATRREEISAAVLNPDTATLTAPPAQTPKG